MALFSHSTSRSSGQIARRSVPSPPGPPALQPESDGLAYSTIYALPIVCSVVSHYVLLYDLFFVQDDRTPTTQAALQFIQLDFSAIGLTVLTTFLSRMEQKWPCLVWVWGWSLAQEPGSVSPGPRGSGICEVGA